MKRQKDQKRRRQAIMANNFWLLKKIWKFTPNYVIWMVIEGVVWGINHSIAVLYMKLLFDALGESAAFAQLAHIILGFALYKVLFYVFHQWYWEYYNEKMRETLHIAMHSELFAQAVRIDLENYDDPVFYNDFIWAMEQSCDHAVGLMEDTGKLINRAVATVTTIGVLCTADVTMAAWIVLLSAVRIGLTMAINRMDLQYRTAMNPLERKDGYIQRVFRLPDYAKELRVTRVKELLFAEYEENVEKEKAVIQAYGSRLSVLQFLRAAVWAAGELGLFLFILYKVMVTKEVGLGTFALAVSSTFKVAWEMQGLVDRLLTYHEHGLFIGKMIAFLDCQPKIRDGAQTAPALETLQIKNLRFSYGEGGSRRYAVDGIDMEIHRGERVAIVGYNGGGKTTLTKLLMRLYDPESGAILYNGKDIREYRIDSLRGHIAAVFQDYRIFACSLAENVAGGACRAEEKGRIEEALYRSTFGEKLQSLPKGLETQLTREFDQGGTQLSGGEQQKVAIARAFYQDADLIILDEPSSALDPDAEYELNQAISEYAGGRTVIFISHRLSTTRNADRIYMFDRGRIIESGTHQELMGADGRYAYMFRLQAEKYQEETA